MATHTLKHSKEALAFLTLFKAMKPEIKKEVHYPLTDKPAKTKLRPAIVVSNEQSNALDKDILVCSITQKSSKHFSPIC